MKKEKWKPKLFKINSLVELFPQVGIKIPILTAMQLSKVGSFKSLKTYCWLLRDEARTRPDRIMDLRIHNGIIERVR